MTTLRWLHFTDLHIGMEDRGFLPAVRDVLQKDLKKLTYELGPWDVVLFTGDLAYSGNKREYDELDKELAALWPILTRDGQSPVLLAVPGNHDLQRHSIIKLVANGLQNSGKSREELWSGRDVSVLNEIEKSFRDYTAWWQQCPYRPKAPMQIQPGLLPGDWSFVLTKEQSRFGFLGMNTAWLDVADEVKEGALYVDVRQLAPACGGDLTRWLTAECDMAMLLSHHPPGWLHRDARQHVNETIVGLDRILAHLCGHLHEATYDSRSQGGDRVRRIWQASALFGMEKLADGTTDRRHGYTAGEIRIESGRAQVRTWPRIAFRMQSQRWQVTADPSFFLENDFANTPAETIPLSITKVVPILPERVISPEPDRTWAEAIAGSMLWSSAKADGNTVALARAIVSACWETWQRGRDTAFPGDPWLHAAYPVRVLDQLNVFLGRINLEPSQVLALAIAPFVYQALVAAASASMMPAQPESLADTTSSTEPRNTLEQIHRKYPALVRRAASWNGEDRSAVLTWFVHRAIALVPVLWSPEPELPLACELQARVDEFCRGRNDIDWARLVDLARLVSVDPGTLEQRSALAVEMPLAEVLHLAARVAMDPREVSDAAVAQLGLDDGFHITNLIGAFGRVRWISRADGLVLSYECEHPVFDYVLRELTESANSRLQRFHDTWSAEPRYRFLLASIPRRLSSAELQPAMDDSGKRYYHLPHVRFVLDHDRIRELLMGERLYGDTTLAIREMYQNALDACRYRKAREDYLNRRGEGQWRMREPYCGRIEIRQDRDEQGRPYIECQDNGVGMTEREVAQLFAVAGRRFVDSSEFVEERAAWSRVRPPIELHPNSQFGIGVLSYFLLADEIRIRTRRFGRTGRLADVCLEVRITSVGGLFQMRSLDPTVMSNGGSSIRLYLRSEVLPPRYEGAEPQRISCYEFLRERLWFAEFDTHVHDIACGSLYWQAGQLAPGGQAANEDRIGATTHPDLWWCHRMEYEGTFMLLVDGIFTHSPDSSEDDARSEPTPALCIINLHGEYFPKLSLDRNRILSWDRKGFESIIRNQAESLLAWPGLSMPFIWDAERYLDDAFVQRITQHICQRNTILDLSPLRLLRDPSTRTKLACPVHVAGLGVFSGDGALLQQRYPENSLEGPCQDPLLHEAYSLLSGFYLEGVPSLAAWRWHALEQHVKPYGILGKDSTYPIMLGHVAEVREVSSERLAKLSVVQPEPIDSTLLRAVRPVPLMTLVGLAQRYHRTLPELLQRIHKLEPLGIRLDPSCRNPEALDIASLTETDLLMLSQSKRYGDRLWLSGHVSPAHVLHKAHELGLAPSYIAARMQMLAPCLGLALDFDASCLDGLHPDELDWRILSMNLDGQFPWLHGSIPAVHLKYVAHKLECSVSQVFARLQALAEPLQLNVTLPCELTTLESFALTSQDYAMLTYRESYGVGWPWVVGSYPAARIVRIAISVGLMSEPGNIRGDGPERVRAIYDRLEELVVLGVGMPKIGADEILELMQAWGRTLDIRLEEPDTVRKLLAEIEKQKPSLDFLSYDALDPIFLPTTGASAFLSGKLMNFSRVLNAPLGGVLDMFGPLGVIPADLEAALRQIDFGAELPSPVDSELADCIQRAMLCGAEHLDGEILAEARGYLYWLSDEEIRARSMHLAPLVEYARRHADAIAWASTRH